MGTLKLYKDTILIAGQSFVLERIKNLDDLVDEISDELFNEDERLPYWAELWPSAHALTEFILENPTVFNDKNILELGCGMGLTTIALSLNNPKNLLATDYEQPALDATQRNFNLNGLTQNISVQLLDWRAPNLNQKYEMIVASDVAYEERFFQPLIDLFQNFLTEKGTIILAEPNRSIARIFFGKLALAGFQFKNIEKFVDQNGQKIRVTIYTITKKSRD
jgi:ETFB lysine methyltransferase